MLDHGADDDGSGYGGVLVKGITAAAYIAISIVDNTWTIEEWQNLDP